MATSFQFSVANDTANGAVSSTLAAEIQSSSITIAQDQIWTVDDVLTITFKADLSLDEETALAAVVSSHQGIEPGVSDPMIVQLSGPMEEDKKPVVVISPASDGLRTWLTGYGDTGAGPEGRADPSEALLVEFDGTESFPADKYAEVSFDECLELHDGQLNWGPESAWGPKDRFALSVVIPATVVTSTPGTGNVNLVPIGAGKNLIVPAAGDGSHTVVLDNAVPVPVPPFPRGQIGQWSCDRATGDVQPDLVSGQFYLLDHAIERFFIPNVGMGNRLGLFDVDVYKTDWIHTKWKLKLSVHKESTGAGYVQGWLLAFRPSNGRD